MNEKGVAELSFSALVLGFFPLVGGGGIRGLPRARAAGSSEDEAAECLNGKSDSDETSGMRSFFARTGVGLTGLGCGPAVEPRVIRGRRKLRGGVDML